MIYLNVLKMNTNTGSRILVALLLFAFQFLLADGTRQVSPGNGSGAADADGTAYYVNPATGFGSYPGSAANSKMKVTINNSATERIYAGFMARTFNNTTTDLVNNAYVRVLNSAGVLISTPRLIPMAVGSAGFIPSYPAAYNGPNIGGANPSGYVPFSFTAPANGDYTIELYRSADGGATAVTAGVAGQVTFPFFDISVAAGNSVIDGRLWSRNWSFITTNLTSTDFPNVISSSFKGKFFVYTGDHFKARVDFSSGFKPLGFQMIMNYLGVGTTGNFADDNKSRNGTLTGTDTVTYPTIPTGYQVFLTNPDSVAFPNGVIGNPAITGAIYGCPGAYFIPYYIDKAGDVAITLDLDGNPGYQSGPGAADRVLQAFDVPAGNNVMLWNGEDNLGNQAPLTISVTVSVLLLQGRINLPLTDAELNTNGLFATSIFPDFGSVAANNRPMFWDDTSIVPFGTAMTGGTVNNNTNITTGGVRTPNLRSGQVGPTHAYDGSTPGLVTPAPLTANQGSNTAVLNDDYGNGRIINTWFYGAQAVSPDRTLSLPSCDNDGDGVSNNLDLDDDNDGILDTAENGSLPDPLGDHDLDSVPNYIDPQAPGFVDTNFDGVDDRYDLDLDGVINQFDTDSDGDGCPDAIEGSENVTYFMVNPMTSAVAPGAIRVLGNGIAIGANQSAVVSTATAGRGVPLVVNNLAGNNTGAAGAVDNTDGTADVGQGVGASLNRLQQDLECRCYRPANSPGVGGAPTNHGITALNRAGANNGNWPMKITGAYTVLDAKTNGFVINRLNTSQINGIVAVKGMMVYDTDANCLKIYDGTVWSCFTRQTCDQF